MHAQPVRRLLVAAAPLLLLLAGAATGPVPSPRRIAVLEFGAGWSAECSGPARKGDLAERCEALLLLTDEARAGALEVFRPPSFILMTRENTAQILKEMGAGAGACVEGECEVETAKLIGADLVISGQVSSLEGTWIASLRLHDVTTAALLATTRIRGQTKLELMDGIKRAVEAMARKALGGDPVTPPAREGAPESPPSRTWDSRKQFTGGANPDGAWSVGWAATLGSAFNAYPGVKTMENGKVWTAIPPGPYTTPSASVNGTSRTAYGIPPGGLSLHPGCAASELSVLRWTSPIDGKCQVEAGFGAGDSGDTTAHLLVDGSVQWTASSTNALPSFSRTLTVGVGKPVDIAVGTGQDNCWSDSTQVWMVVTCPSAADAGPPAPPPPAPAVPPRPPERKAAAAEAKPLPIAPPPAGMARLQGGRLAMAEMKQAVRVAPFVLDVTEVTTAAYGACVRSGRCTAPDTSGSCNWGKAERANHPINCVDWSQAEAYCASEGKRLPTDAEWAWAARGGERATAYPWGNEPARDQLCWNGGSVQRLSKQLGTCAVGSFDAGRSPQGLMDLAGNVWEWTSTAAPDGSSRILRGAAWNDDGPSDAAVSRRVRVSPTFQSQYTGFRCAKTP